MTTTPTIMTSELGDSGIEEPEVVKVVRDDVFYFDKYAIFQVENVLFRIPKDGFLVPGSPFESLFSLPNPGNGSTFLQEGINDDHPIVLEGISIEYFRGFLKVMYPMELSPTYDDWRGALHLATQWYFPVIREKAIDAMSVILKEKDISHGSVVALGIQYQVKDWFVQGCVALLKQPTPLSVTTLHESMLDPLIIAKLLSIREDVYQKALLHNFCNKCKHCRSLGIQEKGYHITDDESHRLVGGVFASEINDM